MGCSIQYFVRPLGTAWNEGHAQKQNHQGMWISVTKTPASEIYTRHQKKADWQKKSK